MKRFTISRAIEGAEIYIIDAESEEEAIAIITDGEGREDMDYLISYTGDFLVDDIKEL